MGNPHPRSYGTNARVLAEYVRARGVLTLEDAIRRMTSLPARTFGLRDRGLIREGMAADLVIFDPARVRGQGDLRQAAPVFARLRLRAVNGKMVVDEGKLTEQRPGQALRHK